MRRQRATHAPQRRSQPGLDGRFEGDAGASRLEVSPGDDRRVGADSESDIRKDAERVVVVEAFEHGFCRSARSKLGTGPRIERSSMGGPCLLEGIQIGDATAVQNVGAGFEYRHDRRSQHVALCEAWTRRRRLAGQRGRKVP